MNLRASTHDFQAHQAAFCFVCLMLQLGVRWPPGVWPARVDSE